MANFCLPQPLANAFKNQLSSGNIDPVALSKLDSAGRRDFFASIVGVDNAPSVNALFESKLLLKNQQQGMINWARKTAGISQAQRKDLIDKINAMKEVLTPENEAEFLEDLVNSKIGVNVSIDEANVIAKLANTAEEAKTKMNDDFTFSTDDERLAFGLAKDDFDIYVGDLKKEAQKFRFKDIIQHPIDSVLKGIGYGAGVAKAIVASLDDSAIGRQGIKILFTHPKIWLKNSAQTFVDIVKTFGGKDVMRAIKADVKSRPNAISGLYKREGLAVGITEEMFPTSLPAKIPILGRIFKASEAAFTGFQHRTRADVFDKLVDVANKTGGDIEGLGKMVNSLTGHGSLGKAESTANIASFVFWSARFIKSNIDALTFSIFNSSMSPYVRKQAAMNTLKIIGGIATVLAIAKAVNPDSVDWDPRSANFGKIKISSTRFDVSGGMSSFAVLAARLKTQETKSSTSGNVRPIDTGKFMEPTSGEVIADFFGNKLSPLVVATLKSQTWRKGGVDRFTRKPVTGTDILDTLVTPFPIKTYFELKNHPDSADILASMLAEALGIGANTY